MCAINSTYVLERKISKKLHLLVLLTYMHILHTTGDTNTDLDLSLLDSVNVSLSVINAYLNPFLLIFTTKRQEVDCVHS